MRRRFGGLLVAAMALAFVLGFSAKADAAFMAYICDDAFCSGGGDMIVTDNGAGDAANLVNGGIVVIGSIGGLSLTINTAQSKPLIGSAGSPQMDLNFTATGVGEAFFFASDTGFTYTGPVSGQIDGNFSGSSQVFAQMFAGSANWPDFSLFSSVLSFNSSPFSGSTTLNVGSGTNPYSLTLGVRVIRTSGGTTTGDFLLVPEPASMALFGLGLLGAGIARRRRSA